MAWVIKKPGAFYGWDFWGYTQNGRLHDEGRWVGRGDAKLYETWGDARDALISMMESKGKEAIGKLGIKFEEVPAAENESSNWVIVRDANGAREVYTPKGSWSRTFERAMLCTKSAAEAKQRVLSGTPGAPWCWVQTAEVAKERMQKEEEPTPMKWAIKRLQLHTGVWEFYKGLGTWEPGIANAKLYATESEALGDWQERRFEVVAVPVRVRLDEGEEAKTVKTKWKVTKADGSSEIVTQLLVKDGWLDAETVASSQDDYLAGLLIPLTNVQSVERVRSEWVLRAKGLAGNREWLSKGGTGVYWTSDKEKAMRFGTHAEAWQQKRHLESLALAVEGRPDVKELVYLAAAAVEVEEVADAE